MDKMSEIVQIKLKDLIDIIGDKLQSNMNLDLNNVKVKTRSLILFAFKLKRVNVFALKGSSCR